MNKKGFNIAHFSAGDTITRVDYGIKYKQIYNESTLQHEEVSAPYYETLMGEKLEYVGIYNNQICVKHIACGQMHRLPRREFEDGWSIYEEIPGIDDVPQKNGEQEDDFKTIDLDNGVRVEMKTIKGTPPPFLKKILEHISEDMQSGGQSQEDQVIQSLRRMHKSHADNFKRLQKPKLIFDLAMAVAYIAFSFAISYQNVTAAMTILATMIFFGYMGLSSQRFAYNVYLPVYNKLNEIIKKYRSRGNDPKPES